MAIIVPTVTAYEPHEYREQMNRLAPFAGRVHIDLMDGEFAPTKSPELERVWWPLGMVADIHLMYQRPMDYLDQLIRLKPHMVIIHNEAHVHHMHFVAELHKEGIQAGLAMLQETPVEYVEQIVHSFDHALIFSGNLGYHGGSADMSLLDKVRRLKHHHPAVSIGWDGGIDAGNARQLIDAGVEVLNVGSFIQKSDNPQNAYDTLIAIAEEEK